MSDWTPEHASYLDQIGLGPNSPPPPPRKILRAEPKIMSLFPPRETAPAQENLIPLFEYQAAGVESVLAEIKRAKSA